ncbi:dihydroflavonol-4-reductase [Deinococcus malanensis]|uniref:Dihydroflavonol-4-reductase n=2 Tax=Deinococcus malanensis TaxID=1706855 RepID=A0ABQ2EZ06_9DEIO|nr:dihydroflavonol-4-reductase [Deinococcus malanensis]
MRVFVTGATGFIGRRVVHQLLQRHHHVTALVRHPAAATNLRALGVHLVPGDVTRPGGLADTMRGSDWLLHLANRYSLYEPDEQVYQTVNVQGNRNVMTAALEAGVRKVVHVSSIVAFGASPDQPLREDSRVGQHATAYARTKHAGDEVVWEHARQGLKVVMVYPGAVLGPGDPKDTGIWIRQLVRGQQPARVFEAGGFTFVHVDDVAQAIVRAAEREGNAGERYLIGREYLTNGEFVSLVSELSGVPRPKLAFPDWLAHAGAAVCGTVARMTRTPPVLGLSRETALHLAQGFRFGSEKAERELGLTYTPVREALRADIATFHVTREG